MSAGYWELSWADKRDSLTADRSDCYWVVSMVLRWAELKENHWAAVLESCSVGQMVTM